MNSSNAANLCFEVAEVPSNAHALVVHQISNHYHKSSRAVDAHSHLLVPHPHGAYKLNKNLKPMEASKTLPTNHTQTAPSQHQETISTQKQNILSNIQHLALKIGSCVQPQGTSHNDDSVSQRVINVVTSIPFLTLGYSILRRTNTSEGRQYGNSMLAVGAAAALYHASAGSFRPIARKIDYWTIAVSSTYMVKATVAPPENKLIRRLLHASLLAVPFRPLTISTLSTLAMQAEFARQAMTHKSMRPHLKKHLIASAASGIAFALEDTLADRGFGHVHGIWHLLATAGVATINPLLHHKENLRNASSPSLSVDVIRSIDSDMDLKRRTSLLKGSALKSCHDSALSLDSLSPGSVNGKSP